MEGHFFRAAMVFLGLVLVSQTGCSPEAQEPTGSTGRTFATQAGVKPDSAVSQTDEAAQSSASGDEPTALRDQLLKLSESAQSAENEFRFGDAANTWRKVRALLVRGYGERSWQVRNCELAIAAAEQEAAFTPHQLDRLRSLAGRQKEMGAKLVEGDHAAALAIASAVEPEVRELFGPDSWLFARFQVQLSRLEQLNRNFDAAIRGCQAALEDVLHHAGPVHPDLESLHGFLAACFGETGQPDLALANLKKSTALALVIWGETSLEYAFRANELGVALNSRGDHATAVRILRASEQIRLKALGADHPLVAHSRLNLGIASMGAGDLATALELAVAAEPVFRKAGEVSADLLVKTLRQRGTLLMLLNRPAEAEAPLNELIARVVATQRPDRQAIRSALQYRLAVCLARQGKFADAILQAQESLSAHSQLLGPAHQETAKARDLLVNLLERTGETARVNELRGSVRPAGFAAPER